MLTLVGRRIRAHWPLLLTVLVVLTVGASLLGTCALLITRTSDRAVEVAAERAEPAELPVTAYAVRISAADARSVADDTRRVLTSSIAPYPAATAMRASSAMRVLPSVRTGQEGVLAEGYLSGIEDLMSQAGLVAGRWPKTGSAGTGPAGTGPAGTGPAGTGPAGTGPAGTGTAGTGRAGNGQAGTGRAGTGQPGAPLEAAVLQSTARLLGLTVGSRVRLGPEVGQGSGPPVDVTVVGIIRPLPDAGWDRDPLGGTGFDPDPEDATSARPAQAYGPFVVDLDALLNGESAVARLEATARPDLSATTSRGLEELSASVASADRRLAGALGDRVWIERVYSPLPQTLGDARRQQEITTAAVLAVALIAIVLTAIALALAGRLTTSARADEQDLLGALGFSRGQLAAVVTAEAVVLAALAAAVSVPASSLLHVALTHLPPLAGAGLAATYTVTGSQALAVGCGALALAALHVAPAVRPAAAPGDRRRRRELLARSGFDLLLVALAAVGWWQLRAQPDAAGQRTDAVRVLAPALLLTAGTVLALRLLPPALKQAERLASRARGLVLPLAAFGAARRPQAVAAGLLIGLGCAAATFGVAFQSTWHLSQTDQADLAVGTDLAVTLAAPPVTGQSAVMGAATGGVISPVVEQNVVVGQWLGDAGDPPRLVALDTRAASGLVRGRHAPGRDWPSVARTLTPAPFAAGYPVPQKSTPTLSGTAPGPEPITVVPRLLLQDPAGLRTTCTGTPVVLDGAPHPVPGCATAPGLRLVAVALAVTGETGVQRVSVLTATLALPAAGSGPAAPWTATAASPDSQQLTRETVTAGPAQLRFTATVSFADPAPLSRVLVASAFQDPGPMPIVVSAGFAGHTGAHVGSRLSLAVDQTAVPAVVTGIIPAVPSAPRAPAVLADVDALSRRLVLRGNMDSPVTGWWVGDPARADAAQRVAGLRLGTTVTRSGETARLAGSPLRASLPALLRVLVAAAVLLVLGGVVLHVTGDVRLRALEVARLRGLGVTRRGIRTALLAEHTAVLVPLLAAGAVVGALATRVLAPPMIRSDTGAAPVPAVVVHWPWGTEMAVLALLMAGSALAVTAVVAVQARHADAEHLRVTS